MAFMLSDHASTPSTAGPLNVAVIATSVGKL